MDGSGFSDMPSEDQSRATFKQGTVLMQQGRPSQLINDSSKQDINQLAAIILATMGKYLG